MRETDKTNLERMRELINQLTEADIAYYKNDAPIMTDLEYRACPFWLTYTEGFRRDSGKSGRGAAYKAHAVCGKNQIDRGSDPVCCRAGCDAELEDGRPDAGAAV